MKVYYDKDADLSLVKGKKVAIIGYGSQGHAHAQNLQDSGIEVTVGLRKGGASWDKAKKGGIKVAEMDEAIRGADIVMVLLPDEHHAAVYKEFIEPNIKKGGSLAFAHGFNIHYGLIQPREDLDVWMVAPKAPGPHGALDLCRGRRRADAHRRAPRPLGQGARPRALLRRRRSAAARPASSRPTSRKRPRPTSSASRRVLCGGCVELVKAGFDTLVEAGYAPEMAYFECLHELKLIVDLMYEGGIGTMNYSISNNAEYGEYVSGPKIIDEGTRKRMKEILYRIQSGEYAKDFVLENRAGAPDAAVAPAHDRGAADREGGRAAARDDAVDPQEPPCRHHEELTGRTRSSRARAGRFLQSHLQSRFWQPISRAGGRSRYGG